MRTLIPETGHTVLLHFLKLSQIASTDLNQLLEHLSPGTVQVTFTQ